MRTIIICMALVTVPLPFPSIYLHNLAMGSKGGLVQPEGTQKSESHGGKDREDGKSGEGITPKERVSPGKEKASPGKKPRIKYREEPGCSC